MASSLNKDIIIIIKNRTTHTRTHRLGTISKTDLLILTNFHVSKFRCCSYTRHASIEVSSSISVSSHYDETKTRVGSYKFVFVLGFYAVATVFQSYNGDQLT